MLSSILHSAMDRLFALAARVSGGRYWKVKLAAAFVVISLFVSFPALSTFKAGQWDEAWSVLATQIEHPFTQQDHESGSHYAKLAFRFTVPMIAHVLHVGIIGCLVLMVLSLFGLFHALLALSEQALKDRADATVAAFGSCFIFLGNVLVSDVRGFFDVVSFFLMALAMQVRAAWLLFALLMLGYFNDERVLIASPLILLWWWLRDRPVPALKELLRVPASAWTFPVSWVAYFGLRHLLGIVFGLRIGDGRTSLLLEQMNNWMYGAWTGLEGYWLPVLGGLLVLLGLRRYALASVFAAAIGVVAVVAWSVTDITRSMAYAFPATFIGFALVARHDTATFTRRFVFITFLLCLFPTYYTDTDRLILYFHTLPMRLLGLFTHA